MRKWKLVIADLRHAVRPPAHGLRSCLLLGVSVLSACGGSKGSQPSAELQALKAMQAAGTLPTLDVGSSVTGTDADGNGVRDDIDKIIAAQTASAAQKSALTQLAQGIQATLTVSVTDPAAVALVADKLNLAVACVWSVNDNAKAPGQVRLLEELTVNTLPRLTAYEQYNYARNGAVIVLPTGVACHA